MKRIRIYLYVGLLILVFIALTLSDSSETINKESEVAKIALRDVGHQLLLANQDSTSLVLPVIKQDGLKYKLSFQNQVSIEPDSLVAIAKRSFQKAELSEFYIVEVIQCSDSEVAYSYKMRNEKDKNIIPCRGRNLPKSCYSIETRFLAGPMFFLSRTVLVWILGFIIILILLDIYFNIYRKSDALNSGTHAHTSIGSFQFYPEQNKLVKAAVEISLSKKECELLEIFIARPNEIIKRDELTKKVWEDNGVIVGRSLDTYISKLRKILKDDESIKLTNVHGVGYKLEIN